MNWRFLSALLVALVTRSAIRAKLDWTYQPFGDSFDPVLFGREAMLFLFLLGVTLAIINAVLGPVGED